MPKQSDQQLGLELGFVQDQKYITEHTPVPKNEDIFICLDIEATGFNSENNDDIIEVAAVKFSKSGNIATFNTLVHTDKQIPVIVQDLTGISNDMLIDKPKLTEIAPTLIDFCQSYPIIGHNINFDLNFLDDKGVKLPGDRIDTFPLAQMLIRNAKSYSLETLSHHFVGHQPSHRALDDVLANIELFFYLSQLWSKHQSPTTQAILAKSDLPYGSYFQQLPAQPDLQLKNLDPDPHPDLADELISTLQNPSLPTLVVTTREQLPTCKEYNAEIITPHYETISESAFNEFIKQDKLDNEQASLALKVLFLQEDNTLPNTSDLQMFGSDYQLLSHLTFNKPQELIVQNKIYAISHNYFFQLLNNNEFDNSVFQQLNIIFCDHPFLEETFTRASTNTIHYNNFSGNNADIAFGLLGILWEKFTDENQFGPLILGNEHFTSLDWPKITAAFNKLEQELPNPAENLIWLIKNRDRPPTLQFMAKNLNYNLTNLQSQFDLKLTVIPFKQDIKQTVKIYPNLPKPDTAGYFTELCHQLDAIINNASHDVCIVTTNHEQIKELFKYCLKHYPTHKTLAQKLSGSAGKIQHKLTETEEHNILICTHQFYLKHQPPFPHLDALILTKLPIGTPQHPYYDIKKQEDPNFFGNYVIPHTTNNLLQTIITGQDAKAIHLLDTRLTDTSYGQTIQNDLANYIEFES